MTAELAPSRAGRLGNPRRWLPYPTGVARRRIYWRYAFAVGSYHLLGLLAFSSWYFSWTGVVLFLIGVPLFGSVGINLCYHRLLSHRSFCCPLWLERVFAVLGACCLQDSPARWVAVHRQHHHRADEIADPHSPLVNLFWAYMGWLFIENSDLNRIALYDRYARDVIRDRFYLLLERGFVWVVLLSWVVFFAGGFLAELALGGTVMDAVQFGASTWLWGVVVRTIAVWHITWLGNSLPHRWGYRNYQTDDNSHNNVLVAIITNGEGWHNNHHADPSSASNQHRWWELDLTYGFLRLLVVFGLAWNVITPSRQRARSSAPA